MKKNLIYKIGITLLALIILGFSYKFFNKTGGAKYDGSITFVLVDENNNEVINEVINYKAKKDDGTINTLFDILNEKYDIVCADATTYEKDPTCGKNSEGLFGMIILEIEDVKTDWGNSYIALYKNDVYCNYGVSNLDFKDKDVIKFKYTALK